jgi:AcrR family transcriptional regulator
MAESRDVQDGETRERLLAAACEVFAEKGYSGATIAQISRRAGANIAAVNYYFRDKKRLYVETWRRAFQRSLKAHPPEGGVAPDAAPEERLRGRITALMQRIADPHSYEFDIIHKELASPTGLLAEVMRESIEPVRRDLDATVRELLGDGASERQVRLCGMSIMAQCFRLMMPQRRHRAPAAAFRSTRRTPDFTVEEIAEHITRFSLAGIREMRRPTDGPGHGGSV